MTSYPTKRPRRERVDWQAEIRKTEQIRRRGFAMSFLSFAVAAAVIFGVGRLGGVEVGLPRRVLSIACLVLACFTLRAVLKRRARLKRKQERPS